LSGTAPAIHQLDGTAAAALKCCQAATLAAAAAPWLTKMANAFLTGKLEARQRELAADAVNNLEKLGPTFIKLGQIMSIRYKQCSMAHCTSV
jgi:predicted unusual protein kinase regulating ubiquinone biosynthesis (AarF/ABC1/UbiB family)